ncbi:SDR family oxidoreductase [Candidatus Xianfuyuplasma coldseepsis]|uniref:SDR family oxidoreductase n=1 Tax=Candidatus Xianfuyuplasma coldseepsis TaxID=2782163 RepID=A0A7L7KR70_9MOLU|nr:SDR family oxidoreductase [Xianfuyuplasma coldseepsis]QMS85321.1 SDR family oxidoreductase [Xianfuyuplasma coldseepsis]
MHVFITGGTRGIGHGLVREFLKQGHQVSYTGTSQTSIEASQQNLQRPFQAFICDVREKTQIVLAKEQAIASFGPIDIWINNAGVDQDHKVVSELSDVEIKRVIDINVTGMMLGTSVALEHMIKKQQGIVYNMEGLGSNNMKIPKTLIYGSSKRLLTYFSQGCNKELKTYKEVFVGTMQPGMVFTELLLRNIGDGQRIARILGSTVEEVTPFLVKHALKKKQRISYLTTRRIVWRFLTRSWRPQPLPKK